MMQLKNFECNQVKLFFEGCLWSLAGAVLYAVYIVMIKRRVDREDKLDIPMFFGKHFSFVLYCLKSFFSF